MTNLKEWIILLWVCSISRYMYVCYCSLLGNNYTENFPSVYIYDASFCVVLFQVRMEKQQVTMWYHLMMTTVYKVQHN